MLRQKLIKDISIISSLKCFLIERNPKDNDYFLDSIEEHIDSQFNYEKKMSLNRIIFGSLFSKKI